MPLRPFHIYPSPPNDPHREHRRRYEMPESLRHDFGQGLGKASDLDPDRIHVATTDSAVMRSIPFVTEKPDSDSRPEAPLLFISHATEDVALAAELRQILVDEGYQTWMAPGDIRGSRPWAEQILEAIAAATVMVVLVSSQAMRSSHVGREVNVAFDHNKAVLPIRIEDVALSGTLRYLLAMVQWVDAFPPPLHRHHERLSKGVADALSDRGTTPQPPLPRMIEVQLHNIPSQVSAFFGREQEVAQIEKLIADHRLVTITGVGGGGKTRLALQVAAEVLDLFPDGVWFVNLAPVTEPGLVADIVAGSFGFRAQSGQPAIDSFASYLRDRTALLLIDNCEHLIDQVAFVVSRLIAATKNARVLATSRERLSITGERVFPMPTLPVPIPGSDLALVEANPAVQMFVDRATALNPSFAHDTPAAIAAICRHLDGIPLAIELAAARTISFTPAQILDRLDQRFRLLTGGQREGIAHHQTLHATIDWSYQLLEMSDRRLLGRLSVFRGDFDLLAAERVCTDADLDPADISVGLPRLVERSLMSATPFSAEMRYSLLETIRQFASERLAESGLREAAQYRHAEHYLDVAEHLYTRRKAEEQVVLDRFQADHENLMAAFSWALTSQKSEIGVRFFIALHPHFQSRGFPGDSQEWVQQLLQGAAALDAATHAEFLMAAAKFAGAYDINTARAHAEQAVHILRGIDDGPEVGIQLAGALSVLAAFTASMGDHARAIALGEEALKVAKGAGDQATEAMTLRNLAEGALETGGDLDQAAERARRAVAILRHSPRRMLFADALSVLGAIDLAQGRYQDAEQHLRGTIKVAGEIPDPLTQLYATDSLARCLLGQGRTLDAERELVDALPLLHKVGQSEGPEPFVTLAAIYHQTERHEAAVLILSLSASLASSTGYDPYPVLAERTARCKSQLRQAVTDSEFEAAWNAGMSLTIDQAIHYAVTAFDARNASISEMT